MLEGFLFWKDFYNLSDNFFIFHEFYILNKGQIILRLLMKHQYYLVFQSLFMIFTFQKCPLSSYLSLSFK